MIMVHDIFICKPGNASKLAKMFKEAMAASNEFVNVLTDMSGQFNKVIMVSQYENLTEYEHNWEKYQKDTEAMKKMEKLMEGYHELVVKGRREIYKLEG